MTRLNNLSSSCILLLIAFKDIISSELDSRLFKKKKKYKINFNFIKIKIYFRKEDYFNNIQNNISLT